jgi:hypothetical protein
MPHYLSESFGDDANRKCFGVWRQTTKLGHAAASQARVPLWATQVSRHI